MKNKFLLVILLLINAEPQCQSLPPVFDLRNYNGNNYVTSVKCQSDGTCWSHSIMAAIESNLLINGNFVGKTNQDEPNLSEYHMDWWNGFNQYFNNDLNPTNGNGLIVHQGGDYKIGAAYLSRGEGAVYSEIANDTTTEMDIFWYLNIPERYSGSYSNYYIRDIDWYNAGDSLQRIDLIKQKIIDHGAMSTCIASNEEFMNSEYEHYQPASSPIEPNHAIVIIGWDDNRITDAPIPGAWLCKNSHGSNYQIDGYFWISYYDKHACKEPNMGAVSFYNVVPKFFDTAYYHDYHGWRDTKDSCFEVFNAFKTSSIDSIEIVAMSFFTAEDSVNYTIKIYSQFQDMELQNELFSQSGLVAHKGFHTIDLNDTISIEPDCDFYVYLFLDSGGQPFDRTSEVSVLLGSNSRTIVNSTADTGQSFFYNGTSWEDFYYSGTPDWQGSGNFCVKPLAILHKKPLIFFDLRSYNDTSFVTPVKHSLQNTSWIHAALASTESNLLINRKELKINFEDTINFSEYHLDYWNGFNTFYNADLVPPYEDGIDLHDGGNSRIIAASFSRGEAPLYYPGANDGSEYDSIWFYDAPLRLNNEYQRYYVKDIEWYSIDDSSSKLQHLKNKILENGAFSASFYFNPIFLDSNYTYFQPSSDTNSINYYVSVIGWNDSITTQSNKKGAWLCKSCNGSEWGNSGFFWISYFDKGFGKSIDDGIVFYKKVVEQTFDTIYYHDYHGWVDRKLNTNSVFNKFIAQDTIDIKAINFFTCEHNVSYTISLYNSFMYGMLMNELFTSRGIMKYKGLHTIDLPFPKRISQNDDFYLFLSLSNNMYAFDRTHTILLADKNKSNPVIINSSASTDQSYFLDSNSIWSDFYYEGDSSWVGTGNFCLKAVVDIIGTSKIKEQKKVNSNCKIYPTITDGDISIELVLNKPQLVQMFLYNSLGMPVQFFTKIKMGNGLNTYNLAIHELSNGIYFIKIITEESEITKKIIKIN